MDNGRRTELIDWCINVEKEHLQRAGPREYRNDARSAHYRIAGILMVLREILESLPRQTRRARRKKGGKR